MVCLALYGEYNIDTGEFTFIDLKNLSLLQSAQKQLDRFEAFFWLIRIQVQALQLFIFQAPYVLKKLILLFLPFFLGFFSVSGLAITHLYILLPGF